MISFGSTKNNLQILKNCLEKMNISQNDNFKHLSEQLTEQNLRAGDNHIFLPLISFILVDYSPELYLTILDIEPTLNHLPDKKFLIKVMILAREFFSMNNVCLEPDEFLSNKYFDKKLEFVANLAKSAIEKAESLKKGKAKDVFEKPKYNNNNNNHNFDLEDEETVKTFRFEGNLGLEVQQPKQKNSEILIQNSKVSQNKQKSFQIKGEEFFEHEIQAELDSNSNKTSKRPRETPAELPSNPKRNSKTQISEPQIESTPASHDNYNRFRLQETNNRQSQNHCSCPSREELVSKEEFSMLMSIVTNLSETVNRLAERSNVWEEKIKSTFDSFNTRITTLENSVRVIKDNL